MSNIQGTYLYEACLMFKILAWGVSNIQGTYLHEACLIFKALSYMGCV